MIAWLLGLWAPSPPPEPPVLPLNEVQIEVKGTTGKPPLIRVKGDFPTPAWTFDGWLINQVKGKWIVKPTGINVQAPGTFVTQVLVPFELKRPLPLPAGTHTVRVVGQGQVLEKRVTVRDDGLHRDLPYLKRITGPGRWPAGKPLTLTVEMELPDTVWRFKEFTTQRLGLMTVVATPWATRTQREAGADVLVPVKKALTLDKLPSGTIRVVVEGKNKTLHHVTEVVTD